MNDSSGLGNVTTVVGGTARFTCGVSGEALRFDGSGYYLELIGAVNSYYVGNLDHTTSFFVRQVSLLRHEAILDKRAQCTTVPGISFRQKYGVLDLEYLENGRNNIAQPVIDTTDCWTLCTVTKQGQSVTVYINSVLTASMTLPAAYNYTNTENIKVGHSVCQNVDGTIASTITLDELMFFNRALSQSEIQAMETTLRSNMVKSINVTDTICLGDSVLINVPMPACHVSTSWAPTSGVANASASNTYVAPEVSTTYQVTVTDSAFCRQISTINMVVDSCLVPCDTLFVTDTLYADTLVQFIWDTLYFDTLTLVQTDTLYITDTLYATDTLIVYQPDTTCSDTVYVYVPDTSLTVILDTVYVHDTVVIVDSIIQGPDGFVMFVPNAFTPNGDGQNDVFRIYGHGFSILRFQVFDRWGELIFESKDGTAGWDGTFKGQILAPQTFVYYIDYQIDNSSDEHHRKGSVVLIR